MTLMEILGLVGIGLLAFLIIGLIVCARINDEYKTDHQVTKWLTERSWPELLGLLVLIAPLVFIIHLTEWRAKRRQRHG